MSWMDYIRTIIPNGSDTYKRDFEMARKFLLNDA